MNNQNLNYTNIDFNNNIFNQRNDLRFNKNATAKLTKEGLTQQQMSLMPIEQPEFLINGKATNSRGHYADVVVVTPKEDENINWASYQVNTGKKVIEWHTGTGQQVCYVYIKYFEGLQRDTRPEDALKQVELMIRKYHEEAMQHYPAYNDLNETERNLEHYIRECYVVVDVNNQAAGLELGFYGSKDALIFGMFMCEHQEYLKDLGMGLEREIVYDKETRRWNNKLYERYVNEERKWPAYAKGRVELGKLRGNYNGFKKQINLE